jgi:AcrR family transcriptional regulator
MQKHVFTDRQIQIMEAATARIDRFGIQELTIKNLAADLNLSEAALYRHFKSKNDILTGILDYFILEMKQRIGDIIGQETSEPQDILRQIFNSQLNSFVQRPSIVSVIFSESIFQFNSELSQKVSEMMGIMQTSISKLVENGQKNQKINTLINHDALTTIIMGSMRMVVLKWKLSGNKSQLVKDGLNVLNGLLKLISK